MLAHLLRESKDIAEKFEEAIPLHNALKKLYDILTKALENDPRQIQKEVMENWREKRFGTWITKEYSVEKSEIHRQ